MGSRMKDLIEWVMIFSVSYFIIMFARLYYYVHVKKENKETIMQEIREHGPFFKHD